MEILQCFIVGGLFCVLAQILIDKTSITPARILTLYVVLGVVLSAVGIYDEFIAFGGYGARLPLCGFGHVLAEGVKKGVEENGFLGILQGGITSSSAGIGASIVFSLLFGSIFKGKPENL